MCSWSGKHAPAPAEGHVTACVNTGNVWPRFVERATPVEQPNSGLPPHGVLEEMPAK